MAKKINLADEPVKKTKQKKISEEVEDWVDRDEAMEEVNEEMEENKNDFLEIRTDGLYIKIPNELVYVSRARKILQAYEEELFIDNRNIIDSKNVTPELESLEEQIKSFEDEIEAMKNQKDFSNKKEFPNELNKRYTQEISEDLKQEEKPKLKSYDFCPLCNGKLKKGWLKQEGDKYKQKVKCKNRKCSYKDELVFSV